MERLSASASIVDQLAAPITPLVSAPDKRALEQKIKRAIRTSTRRRVNKLSVDVQVTTVVLDGQCGTYYCKQMAQQAALTHCGERQVVNRIRVDYAN